MVCIPVRVYIIEVTKFHNDWDVVWFIEILLVLVTRMSKTEDIKCAPQEWNKCCTGIINVSGDIIALCWL